MNEEDKLAELYNEVKNLDSQHQIYVYNRDNSPCAAGLKEIEGYFTHHISFSIDEIFKSRESFKNLCLISGGRISDLRLIMLEIVSKIDTIPIPDKELNYAIKSYQKELSKALISQY